VLPQREVGFSTTAVRLRLVTAKSIQWLLRWANFLTQNSPNVDLGPGTKVARVRCQLRMSTLRQTISFGGSIALGTGITLVFCHAPEASWLPSYSTFCVSTPNFWSFLTHLWNHRHDP
jgi:hypothetical protein